MGGSGSGTWYRYGSKETTESQHRIDIRWMRQQGYLRPGNIGTITWSRGGKKTGSIDYIVKENHMVLDFRYRFAGGEWKSATQNILFDRTPCNYGGFRNWFLCPQCWKRVGPKVA